MVMEWMRRGGEGFGDCAGELMNKIIRRGEAAEEQKKKIKQRHRVRGAAQRRKRKADPSLHSG